MRRPGGVVSIFSIGLGLIGILIGVASVVVGRHHHRKSLEKRLTVYIYGSRQVLKIDESIADLTKASFKDREINSVFGLRYLIENDGTKPISNCIEPLSVTTKSDPELLEAPELLDARVLYSQPDSPEVRVLSKQISGNLTKTSFDFSLLNKGDLFIIQLLFNGYISAEKLKFKIRGEDLPPTISPIYQPIPLHNISKPNRLAWWSWVGGGSLGILAVLAIAFFAFLSPANLLGQGTWWAYFFCPSPGFS